MAINGAARHVVWDWNGTLLDDLPQIHKAVNDALEVVDGPCLTLDEYMAKFARPLSGFYRRVLNRELGPGEWAAVDERFKVSYHEYLPDAVLAPNVADALRVVAEEGTSQSILSMYPHDYLGPLVKRMGLAGFFDDIQGCSEQKGESKAGMFAEHVRTVAPETPPGQVVMIGDTIDDVRAAHAAGSGGVFVSHHGYCPTDDTYDEFHASGLLDALAMAGFDIDASDREAVPGCRA